MFWVYDSEAEMWSSQTGKYEVTLICVYSSDYDIQISYDGKSLLKATTCVNSLELAREIAKAMLDVITKHKIQ